MKFATWRTGTYLCSLAAMLSAPALWATQPTPLEVSMEARYARRGPSFLHVVNHTRRSHRMTFAPGPGGTLDFRNVAATLEPGAAIDLGLGQLAFVEGVNVLEVTSIASDRGDGSVMPGPTLYEVLIANSDGVRLTTYEDAFLTKRRPVLGESRPVRIDLGGGYFSTRGIAALAFPSLALDGPPKIMSKILPLPPVLANMAPKQLPDFSKAKAQSDGDNNDDGDGDGRVGREDRATRGHYEDKVTGLFGGIQGSTFLKIPAGNSVAFDPAWGFHVRAWNLIGDQWLCVGSGWVASDGTWTINYVLPLLSTKVRVEFAAENRFLQLQDTNGNVYTWGDNWTVNKVTDIGLRSIDLTNTGDAPGIDKIFTAAMNLWHAFWRDGMNATRDQPIQITFPNNDTNNCSVVNSNNVTVPWSCSQSSDGKIWLISQHAKAGVVQHEMAHSIHSYYWGSFPNGSGGQHSLTGCFNSGLALTEGFADFMPYWVQFNRNNPAPVEPTLGYNIETPGVGFCSGATNEVHVSATFWDVHDTHNDGVAPRLDDWNFIHHGAAVGTFLNNSGNNSMTNFFAVYSIILGPAWNTRIFETFLLNTIF